MRKQAILVLGAVLGLAVFVELGIHFDWNKSEWASWVQAVGSIAAILAACAVAWWQTWLMKSAARDAKRERLVVLFTAIYTLMIVFESDLSSLTDLLRTDEDAEELRQRVKHAGPFVEVERSAQAIPLHELPDAATVRVVIEFLGVIRLTRQIVGQVLDHVDHATGLPALGDTDGLLTLIAATKVSKAACVHAANGAGIDELVSAAARP
jgi:hypothetical protein